MNKFFTRRTALLSSLNSGYYPDTPIFSRKMIRAAQMFPTIYMGSSTNPGITETDILKIIADIEFIDARFVNVSSGTQWQKNIEILLNAVGVESKYSVLVNCRGIFANEDQSQVYLCNSDGSEQTQPAFILVIGEQSSSTQITQVIYVLSNNDYVMTGNYDIYKKVFD